MAQKMGTLLGGRKILQRTVPPQQHKEARRHLNQRTYPPLSQSQPHLWPEVSKNDHPRLTGGQAARPARWRVEVLGDRDHIIYKGWGAWRSAYEWEPGKTR